MADEPHADVTDMYMAHSMFRRESSLAPALVREVPAGDVERAAVVAGHIAFVERVLLHHHHAEDVHLWPRLLERGSDGETGPVVRVMEDQHARIAETNVELAAALVPWRERADPRDGAALAGLLDGLGDLVAEHLDAEEARALPLVERYVTAAEWDAMVGEEAGAFDPADMLLGFGMMAYGADPAAVRAALGRMPPGSPPDLADQAERAWADYAERVYGTRTPGRNGDDR